MSELPIFELFLRESEAKIQVIFQPKTQAETFLLNHPPGLRERRPPRAAALFQVGHPVAPHAGTDEDDGVCQVANSHARDPINRNFLALKTV